MKLQETFQKFGNILSCKVVTSDDGKSKGYGFVQFETEASAKAAIEKLNGLTDGGKQMCAFSPIFFPHFLCFSETQFSLLCRFIVFEKSFGCIGLWVSL